MNADGARDLTLVLRELLDDAREGLLALDANGTIVLANEAAAAHLDHPREHLVGKPLAALVALDDRRPIRAALARAARASRATTTIRLGRASAETLVSLRSLGPTPTRWLLVTFDADLVHPRTTQPRRRSPEHDVESFLLRLPLAAVALDGELRMVRANLRACELLGLASAATGRPLSEVADPHLQAVAERLVRLRAPIRPVTIDLDDGRAFHVAGVPGRGRMPAVIVFDDVTETVMRGKVMQEFVRNAAHQLRTPLTGIVSAVQVLQSGAKDVRETRNRFLEHVERHAERLTRITRGLLSLARAQAGSPLQLEPVELCPLLAELAAEADATSFELECEPGAAALCEPDLMHEAVAALVENALTHADPGPVRLAAFERDGTVHVEVTDSGPGIAPEHRDRLLEPFYRGIESGEGFGLGLAITAQAVAAMDGTLEIELAGEGTRCTIRLPSARVAR